MMNPEANFLSPLKSQPIKKLRAGSTPSSGGIAGEADDAMARRRAELRRLAEQRTSSRRPQVTTTEQLLSSSPGVAAGPPPKTMAKQPPPVPPQAVERVRHSDVFPTVAKSTSSKPPISTRITASAPAPASAGVSSLPLRTAPLAPAPASGGHPPRPPPPPPVARKLEYGNPPRAKSAPPARPPPPPPPGLKANPPSKEAPSRVEQQVPPSKPPPPQRPAPVSLTQLLSTSTASGSTQTEPGKPDNTNGSLSTKMAAASGPSTDSSSAKLFGPLKEPPKSDNSNGSMPMKTQEGLSTKMAAARGSPSHSSSAKTPGPLQEPPRSDNSDGSMPLKTNGGHSTKMAAARGSPTESSSTKTPGPLKDHKKLADGAVVAKTSGTAPKKEQREGDPPTEIVEDPPAPVSTPQGSTKTISHAIEDDRKPVNDVKTAVESETGQNKTAPPSTVRRDKIRNIRQGLDSPPTQKVTVAVTTSTPATGAYTSEAAARTEKAYRKKEEERLQALRQVRELEEMVMKLQQASTVKPNDQQPFSFVVMEQMLKVADTQGDEAAIKWARQHAKEVAGSNTSRGELPLPLSSVGFRNMIPESPVGLLHSPGRRKKIGQRSASPHPKLLFHHIDKNGNEGSTTPPPTSLVQFERQWIKYFREAVQCIPFEYTSPESGNTFVIRRPYGTETAPALFELASETPRDLYSRRAHVSTPSTIEVAVTIAADNSVLLLFGVAGVRYRTNPNEDFVVVPNVDESDRGGMLGTVSYIDSEANEKDYSLDDILDEALEVRERYCSTLTSTAMGFRARPKEEKLVSPTMTNAVLSDSGNAAAQQPKVSTASIGVDTSDIPYPPATIEITKDNDEKASHDAALKPGTQIGGHKPSQQVPEEESSNSSGDVLAIFLGMIIKSIFRLIWWILVTLPLTTIKTSVIMMLSIAIVGMAYLYALENGQFAKDDGRSGLMLATSNPYLGYHSNQVPGLF